MSRYEKKKSRISEFLAGRGFYIVLILCIAAVGISGYMLLFSDSGDESDYLDDPSNSELLDKIILPTLPGETPNLEDALTLEDVPAAAVTIIPAPPKKSPAPSPAPSAQLAGATSLTPAPTPSPTPSPTPEASATPEATPTPKPSTKIPGVFVWPLTGAAVNTFSADDLVYNKTMDDWRVHKGIDIECALGAQVNAVADGTVTDIYDDAFLGTTVVIEHSGGLVSSYSNLLKKPTVVINQAVTAGQVIGGVGQTAEGERREVNHLHFEIQLDKVPVNPLDYLPKE